MPEPSVIPKPASFLFRPLDDVVAEIGELPAADQAETIRRMLHASQTSAMLAQEAMSKLGLDDRMDLLKLAVDDPWAQNVRTKNSLVEARRIAARRTPTTLNAKSVEALKQLGVDRANWQRLVEGEVVHFSMAPQTPTGQYTEGFLELKPDRLISGIVTVRDEGGGARTILAFRSRSFELAAALGLNQIEIVGAAIRNDRLGRLLVRQGFELGTCEIPEAFGSGMMDVLHRCYEVTER